MIRIGILGSKGRMGRALVAAIAEAGAIHAGGADRGDDTSSLARVSDVLVDFSAPTALPEHLAAARAAGTAIVVGTTGLDDEHHRLIDEAASEIAVLQAANTSLGVTVLAALVEQAAARLGPDWDVEIVEMHHRHKRDAPSGTALALGAAVARGRGRTLRELGRYDRFERTSPREDGTIGFASLRGGSVAGEHAVILAGEGERLTLGHVAEDRAIFSRGAVRAALWLAQAPPGRYAMQHVLGL